ncbi:REP element-mobilizing transposase RayT [Marinilabilia salmonicolor]|uniref:REP-associated tyrosine transposase n=1 Tax=Marinilabilia salmonicolor TaxID=989 RepID=UPI000D05CA9C|nr:transposase [Marinilabilia salmonicolor]PRZ01020.1 REP element-mobilizing transposase RayT [Marinilabilia salmonicolor]
MSTGYQIKDQEGLYFLTFQVVEWVDIFTRPVYRDIVIDSLKYAIENKGLQVFAYVIMSNHVHLIMQSSTGQLSNTIRAIKKYTSKQIIDAILSNAESRREWLLNCFQYAAQKHKRNTQYQVWTHENHAVYLYSPDFIAEKIQYIHNNPVRAMVVQDPEDYLYSSSRNYASLSAILDIEPLVLPVIVVR